MLQKLRLKFIGFASLSVFILLLVILGSINITNFALVADKADTITASIAASGGKTEFTPWQENSGSVNPHSGDRPGQGPKGPADPNSMDMMLSVRYVTISFDTSSKGSFVNMGLSFINENTALTWASEIQAGKAETGWKNTYYRFRKYTHQGQAMVTFIDSSRELSPSYNVLNASVVGGLAGIFITFLVLIPISKILVKPTEESIRRQKRFISDASHELKTPLTIISANNELNAAFYGETEQTQNIAKQIKAMNNLVKSLNSLAKLDEGEKGFEKKEFDLSLAISDILPAFGRKFHDKKVDFSADYDENILFHGIEFQMRSLFNNILDNALKYAKSHATFSCKSSGGRITIIVKNDAEGIEDGSLDRVFERFYRSDTARASEEGSGLGLALVKEIVALHKGRCLAYGENGSFIIKITF